MFKPAKSVLLVVFILICFKIISADISIGILSSKKKEIDAGSSTNFLISMTNHKDTIQLVDIYLILPDGWRQIMDYKSIPLDPNKKSSKIISIYNPESTISGDYPVKVLCLPAQGATEIHHSKHTESSQYILDSCTIPVFIKPRYEISIEKQKAPKYLFAGDTTRVTFKVRNFSNLPVEIETVISNTIENISTRYKIPIDSFVDISTKLETAKDIVRLTQKNITLSAKILNQAHTNTYSNFFFDIIPSRSIKFDGFNRYPISISTIAAYSNRLTTGNLAYLYDIKGSGIVNAQKERQLLFHFRGPDHRGNPLLGLSDEYYLNYKSRHLKLVVGDYNFKSSDLTESSRYGRGARLDLIFKNLGIGAFVNFPRFFPEIKYTYALNSELKMGEKSSISGGYFAKTDKNDIRTELFFVSGNLQLHPKFKTIFELALGNKNNQWNKSYKTQFNYTQKKFYVYLSAIRADKFFPGFLSNAFIFNSGINTFITKKWSLGANYDSNISNMELDTLFRNAPKSVNKSINTNFNPNSFVSLGLTAQNSAFEDRSPIPLFNYQKDFVRLKSNFRVKDFNLNLYGDYGYMVNYLIPELGKTDYFTTSIQLRQMYKNLLSINSFINYNGGKEYTSTGNSRIYYGGAVALNIKKKFTLSVDYLSNYEITEYYRDRSLLSGQMSVELFKYHLIQFGANYNLVKNSLNQKEINLQMRYTYTLNAPISRKKNVGSLRGVISRVQNYTENKDLSIDKNNSEESSYKTVEKGLQGVMLNLNGEITLTDKEGRFNFPSVKTGSYDLAIDESNFEINTITDRPAPYKVDIEAGREQHFKLKLIPSCKLEGRINIVEDKNNDTRKVYLLKTNASRLIVELKKIESKSETEDIQNPSRDVAKNNQKLKELSKKNSDDEKVKSIDGKTSSETSVQTELYRIYSSPDGTFSFSDLRPGKWRLKIYKNGLPQGFSLEEDEFDIELISGQTTEAEVRILKKNRVIRFQK